MNKFTFEEKFKTSLEKFMSILDGFLRGAWKKIDYECNGARSKYNRVQMVKNEPYVFIICFGDSNTRIGLESQLVVQYEEQEDKLIITDIHSILHSEDIGIMTKDFDRAYSKEVLTLIGHELKALDISILKENKIRELKEDLNNLVIECDTIEKHIKELKISQDNIMNEAIDISEEISVIERI